jgi:hypothetical protein
MSLLQNTDFLSKSHRMSDLAPLQQVIRPYCGRIRVAGWQFLDPKFGMGHLVFEMPQVQSRIVSCTVPVSQTLMSDGNSGHIPEAWRTSGALEK